MPNGPGRDALALLKAAGYRTGLIGKLNVEPAQEFPFDWQPSPNQAGLTRRLRWVAEQSREFMPTILKAAAVPVPENLAGQPIQPLLQGIPSEAWRAFHPAA